MSLIWGAGLRTCRQAARLRRITVDQIASVPFAALLKGMLSDDLAPSREPRPVQPREGSCR